MHFVPRPGPRGLVPAGVFGGRHGDRPTSPVTRGRSSMVEPQSSKLATRVRFPSPAPLPARRPGAQILRRRAVGVASRRSDHLDRSHAVAAPGVRAARAVFATRGPRRARWRSAGFGPRGAGDPAQRRGAGRPGHRRARGRERPGARGDDAVWRARNRRIGTHERRVAGCPCTDPLCRGRDVGRLPHTPALAGRPVRAHGPAPDAGAARSRGDVGRAGRTLRRALAGAHGGRGRPVLEGTREARARSRCR